MRLKGNCQQRHLKGLECADDKGLKGAMEFMEGKPPYDNDIDPMKELRESCFSKKKARP